DFDFVGVKNDTSFDVSARNLIKGGFTVKRANARYDYDGEALIRASLLEFPASRLISNHAHLGVTSTEVAVYASDRFKVADRVILETGARWETESHTPDGGYFSPRVNGAWMVSPSTTLRAAWGWFYQPQGVYE